MKLGDELFVIRVTSVDDIVTNLNRTIKKHGPVTGVIGYFGETNEWFMFKKEELKEDEETRKVKISIRDANKGTWI